MYRKTDLFLRGKPECKEMTEKGSGSMMYSRFLKLFAVITLFFVVITVIPLQASELEEQEQKLNSVKQQINQQQGKLTQKKKEERRLLSDLDSIEKNIESAQSQLNKIESRLGTTKNEIVKNQGEIEKTKEELDKHTEQLGKRLKEMYVKGNVEYLEILLESEDFSELLTRTQFIKRIFAQDVELQQQIKTEKEALEDNQENLEQKKISLIALQKVQEKREGEMKVQLASRENILRKVQTDRKAYEQSINELEAVSHDIQKELSKIPGYKGPVSTGPMIWPTQGRVSSPFGYRIHPIFKTKKLHTGIDIAAPMGRNIVAANDGKVLSAGWRNGYGRTLMIDHGKGITTLYAHTSKLLVKKGDIVSKGQIVAKVGSTGYSTGPHLHFEVRVNGAPKNPMGWL